MLAWRLKGIPIQRAIPGSFGKFRGHLRVPLKGSYKEGYYTGSFKGLYKGLGFPKIRDTLFGGLDNKNPTI